MGTKKKRPQENAMDNGSLPAKHKRQCIFKKNKVEDRDIANCPEII